MIRLLCLLMLTCLIGLPSALAEHSVPYCYGGEVGYWTPGLTQDGTVLLYLTKTDEGVLTPDNTICRVANDQKLKAVPLDKLAAYHKEGI